MYKAFAINLARRPDRYTAFIERNESLWNFIDVQRVEAVDGQTVDVDPLRHKISEADLALRPSELRGTIACSLSHQRALGIIAGLTDRFALVFEDDAMMAKPWVANRLAWIFRSVPKDADLAWLGGPDIGIGPRRKWLYKAMLSNSLTLFPKFSRWETEFLKTTEAYAVSPRFAAVLCGFIDRSIGAIDRNLLAYAQRHREAIFYRHAPPIFVQADRRDSDIRQHQFAPNTRPLCQYLAPVPSHGVVPKVRV